MKTPLFRGVVLAVFILVEGRGFLSADVPGTSLDAPPGTEVPSGDLPSETSPRISGLRFSGLKRTRPAVAERILKKFIGAEVSALEYNEVQAAIIATGILEPLSVEAVEENGEWLLKITVREKWAVFPLPVAVIGSEGLSIGGFFADTNAFGLNDKFFLGGMYHTSSWLVTGGYMHTPLGERFPGWRTMLLYTRRERRDTDQAKGELRFFDLDSIQGRVNLNYSFRERDLLSFSLFYNELILRDRERAFRGPESSARFIGFEPGFSLKKNTWDGYLLSEESASLEYAYILGFGSSSYHTIRFVGVFQKSLVPGFRLSLKAGGLFAPGAPVLREQPPSYSHTVILPASFSAIHYAGTSLGLEKYLVKFSFGTLSLSVSWQGVWSEGSILKNQFDQGIAGAVSLYLSRLAIPALSFGAAYNISARYLQGAFSLGMSF
jgi:hypothetical protein